MRPEGRTGTLFILALNGETAAIEGVIFPSDGGVSIVRPDGREEWWPFHAIWSINWQRQ
jgi:hypothetical protein